MKLKKVICGTMLAAAIMTAGATAAMAAVPTGNYCGKAFVDANGDGICDNNAEGQCAGTGQGICGQNEGCGRGLRRGGCCGN